MLRDYCAPCNIWVRLNAELLQMLLLKFYSICVYALEYKLITKEIKSVLTLEKKSQNKDVLNADSNHESFKQEPDTLIND